MKFLLFLGFFLACSLLKKVSTKNSIISTGQKLFISASEQIKIRMRTQSQFQTKGVSQIESQALMNHSIFMTLSQIEEICNYISGHRKSKKEKKFGQYDPCDYRDRNFDILQDQLVLSVSTVEQHHKLFRKRHPGKQIILPQDFSKGQVLNQIDKFFSVISSQQKFPRLEELLKQFKKVLEGNAPVFDYFSYFSKEQDNKPPVNHHKLIQKVKTAQNIASRVASVGKNSQIRNPSFLKSNIRPKNFKLQSDSKNNKTEKSLPKNKKQLPVIQETIRQEEVHSTQRQQNTFNIFIYEKGYTNRLSLVQKSKITCQKEIQSFISSCLDKVKKVIRGKIEISRILVKKCNAKYIDNSFVSINGLRSSSFIQNLLNRGIQFVEFHVVKS